MTHLFVGIAIVCIRCHTLPEVGVLRSRAALKPTDVLERKLQTRVELRTPPRRNEIRCRAAGYRYSPLDETEVRETAAVVSSDLSLRYAELTEVGHLLQVALAPKSQRCPPE